MGTKGRRKALKALASTRRANVTRLASGKKPKMGGKSVSPSTFAKKTGMTKTKAKAIKADRSKK